MRKRRWWWMPCIVVLALVPASAAIAQEPPHDPAWRDLAELSLEELANTDVTVVSKTPKSKLRTAAAVDVVTSEDIRRSGTTSLAEAVRHVPGVHVARINSNQWAVGIRGFTSQLARSQLVVIDGRSVYSTLFAGTFWDVQDVVLEDVERIEVVRGPGGTLWGANAVNGIVNVVTRSAADTQGGFITAGGGNEQRFFVRGRHGGRIGSRGAYRVYGKYSDRANGFLGDRVSFDDSRMLQGGFRADWEPLESDGLTIQGDVYSGRIGQRGRYASYTRPFERFEEREAKVSGANLIARWSRTFANQSALEVQTYYDRTKRDEVTFGETRDTGDLDLQYVLPLRRHELIVGGGYRVSIGSTSGVETVIFDPARKTDRILSLFVQDEIVIVPDRAAVTIGTKFERNQYSGSEFQPSIRAAFFPSNRSTIWSAVTRAVRTPSRLDRDLDLTSSFDPDRPIFLRAIGNDDFESERVFAYEAGYRRQATEHLYFSLAAFHNHYPNLFSVEQGVPFIETNRAIVPFTIDNLLVGRATGAELSVEARPTNRVSFKGTYSYLNMNLRVRADSKDASSAAAEDASPRHMFHLLSTWELNDSITVRSRFRFISRLRAQNIPSYAAVDARLTWRAASRLELSLTGQNLFDPHHGEFGAASPTFTEVERSLFGEATWRW